VLLLLQSDSAAQPTLARAAAPPQHAAPDMSAVVRRAHPAPAPGAAAAAGGARALLHAGAQHPLTPGGARPAAPVAPDMGAGECFAYFNPVAADDVQPLARRWGSALVRAAEFFIEHPPAAPAVAAAAPAPAAQPLPAANPATNGIEPNASSTTP